MAQRIMQRRGVLAVAIVLMFVLAFAGIFMTAINGSSKSASAVSYYYDSSRDGATLNSNGSLTVTFCVDDGADYWGGSMIQWVVYLFDPQRNLDYGYDNTHQYYESAGMGRDTADYYFMSGDNTNSGVITVTIPADAPAYSGGPQDASSLTDYQGYNTNKTLIQVMNEKNWNVSIGPFWNNGWASTGKSYNVDYFVGSGDSIIANGNYQFTANDAIAFRDYDGTLLADASKTIAPPQSAPTRSGYTFDGWYCDTTKKVYSAIDLSSLTADDVLANSTHANFYATYKKDGAPNDYLEFMSFVVSAEGDYVDEYGNVGRPYASVNNMDYVYVQYDITRNPGINNLLVVLDYDTTAFSLDYDDSTETLANVVSYAETSLGTPDLNKIDAHEIIWDKTGAAFTDTTENFLTVRYTVNKESVVSGKEYFFGVKIYPYIVNDTSIANRFSDELGEQVDVPITQIVRSFTPVVRQAATITIGGNIDNDPRYYERLYGSQFTTEKVATLPTAYDEEYVDSEYAYIVRYTYNGDATVEDENLHIVWMTYVDYSDYITYDEPYTELDAAPILPGHYVVMISADETLNYYAAAPVYCEVFIQKLVRSITIGNPGHIYSNNPEALYSSEDTSGITFSAYIKTRGENPAAVTLNSNTDVGTYDIYYDLSYNQDIYYVTVNGSEAEGNGIKSNRTYTVSPKPVAFTIADDKTHIYGNNPVELTFEGSETGITFTPSVDVTPALSSTTPVGGYDILYTLTAEAGYSLSNYAITVNGVSAGAAGDTGINYTVTKKTIYLKAADQIHVYTGAEVTNPYSGAGYFGFYTDAECEDEYTTSHLTDFNAENITIDFRYNSYDEYIAMGDYENEIVATYTVTDPNHTIQSVYGTLSIRGTEADYFYQFFTVYNETYNGDDQVMIKAADELPAWITSIAYKANSGSYGAANYEPEGATDTKVNAGTYSYTVKLTLSDATYYDGQTNVVEIAHQDEDGKRLMASIAKAAITLGAVGGSHTYGQNPTMNYADPTSGTEYTSSVAPFGDLVVATSIDTANNALTSATNAGTYTVTVSATSEGDNFEITYDPEEATYTVTKATPSINLVANNVYYNRDLDVTATVTPNVGTATLTYYTDSACTIAVDNNTPVNAGTYYVKASVEGNSNYNGYTTPEAVSFDILKVQLKGVEFSYLTPGYATWSAVTSDYGKTVFNSNETGVAAADIKSGTTLEYDVYEGGVKIETISSGELSLQARVAGQAYYYVITRATNNDNYLDSPLVQTVNSYSVTYACDHANAHSSLDNTTHELPAVQYRFGGQSVTLPAMNALGSYNFLYWNLNNNHYNAGSSYQINGSSVTFYAVWSQNTYKVYLKYFNEFTALELNCVADSNVTYSPSALAKLNTFEDYSGVADDDYRVVAWKYNGNVVYTITGEEGDTIDLGMNPTGAGMVFDAVLEFAIDYYMLEGTAAGAEAYENVEPVTEFVEYNTAIDYQTVDSEYAWFRTDYWYADANRTSKDIPTAMPASRVAVYGAYKFDIGAGDVNGSGTVTADDITLYRKWIVGGYEMTVIEAGNEWATVTDNAFDPTAIYFIKRVADINDDDSKDIRDVSITRMSLVGGYTWDIVSGENVTGNEVVRNQTVGSFEALTNWFANGHERISLTGDVTSELDLIIETDKNIQIDLSGYKLTVRSVRLLTTGEGKTITVKNGTIIATDGITIMAPGGNVIISNVTAYDDGNEINLQAASSSLHLFGAVAFRNGNVSSSTAADVKVAGGTHIVIERSAQVVAKSIVAATVTNNVFVADTTVEITVTNDSSTTEAIEIVGNYYEDNSTVESKVYGKVSTEEELIAANGKTVYLGADIVVDETAIVYSHNTVIDLNGHSVTFAQFGFVVINGADLTIKGEGNVTAVKTGITMLGASNLYLEGGVITSTADCAVVCREGSYATLAGVTLRAQEACVVARGASHVTIESGSYTSYDNFVIGTNGTNGEGGNYITINGGTFVGGIQTNGYIACGVYVANNDIVAINGGTFNITNGIGILARSGNTAIDSDVVINITGGTGRSGKVGDKKLNITSGSEIVTDATSPAYPGGPATVTYSGDYTPVVLG